MRAPAGPDGTESEVIIPDIHATYMTMRFRMLGVKIIEVKTPEELEAAFNETHRDGLHSGRGTGRRGFTRNPGGLAVAKKHVVPVSWMPPPRCFRLPDCALGAQRDARRVQRRKVHPGPQAAGCCWGDKNLLRQLGPTAPHHAFGRR